MKKILFTILTATAGVASAQTTELWGTAYYGGTLDSGTIFKADANGSNFQMVYSFVNATGANPIGSLVLANNCKLYGVTALGGYDDSCVIYSYEPSSGIYTKIYDSYAAPQYGFQAASGMIKASNGMLYGLCSLGGLNYGGVIFKIDPANDFYTDIFDFDSLANPYGSLVQLSDGKLYGMTNQGGINNAGVLFSFDPSNSSYLILHDFDLASGCSPLFGNLLQATNLKLYGMTYSGGIYGYGVIFSFDPATGVYSDIHDFDEIHGGNPGGTITQASNSTMYGMTKTGGANGYGVLFSFEINTANYTDLLDFTGLNGAHPSRGLTQASNGLLYGTTDQGGSNNSGVSFSYDITTNIYTKLVDFDNSTIGGNPICELIEIPINCSTGIEKTDKSNDLKISPNPTTGTIQLTFNTKHNAPLKCEIINVMGETVFKSQIVNPKSQINLDVSFLAKGIYVVRVGDGERWENRKLVVE